MVQTAHAWSVLVAAHAVAASLALVAGGLALVGLLARALPEPGPGEAEVSAHPA